MESRRKATELSVAGVEANRRVLELLHQKFGSASAAGTEIINLEAILNLPKGTEHFVADLHGEVDAFRHILKNASGNIKRKVQEIFASTLSTEDINQLCALIYYPEQKLQIIAEEHPDPDIETLATASAEISVM